MDSEILKTLQEIRDIVHVVAWVVTFCALVWAANWASSIVANFKKTWENDFFNRADKYFQSANYEKLIEHCEEKLRKYPNHSNATWWLARANKGLGNQPESKALFEKLLELEPSWKETHIEPYLKSMSSE